MGQRIVFEFTDLCTKRAHGTRQGAWRTCVGATSRGGGAMQVHCDVNIRDAVDAVCKAPLCPAHVASLSPDSSNARDLRASAARRTAQQRMVRGGTWHLACRCAGVRVSSCAQPQCASVTPVLVSICTPPTGLLLSVCRYFADFSRFSLGRFNLTVTAHEEYVGQPNELRERSYAYGGGLIQRGPLCRACFPLPILSVGLALCRTWAGQPRTHAECTQS
jgi:hypothetical protein